LSVKSILRRPQIRFSDDPFKLAAGTHVATPKTNAEQLISNKALPDVPNDVPGTPSHRQEKHVVFSSSPSAVVRNIGTPGSPSPSKMPGQYPATDTQIPYPTIQFGDTAPVSPSPFGNSPNKVRASMAAPGDFTFRSGKTISFGDKSTTIRPVRASDTSVLTYKSPSKLSDLPSVPHGLSNKKRKRDSDVNDESENKENDSEQPQETSKRTKMSEGFKGQTAGNGANIGKTMTAPAASGLPKPKGRSVLSMSRLNALSKPKDRK